MAWDKGSKANGTDSLARLVASKSHWPSMKALILVVSAEKKGVSSTAGMQLTVKTSSLFQKRTTEVVPQAMVQMEQAILDRDFETFGRITMKESNSFHATCLDTEPPIFYLNDVSRAVIRAVENVNEKVGKIVAAYTFDAGPNAVIYYLEEQTATVAGAIHQVLPDTVGWEAVSFGSEGTNVPFDEKVVAVLREGVSRVILTEIGEGPVGVNDHLIDEKGEPVSK